MARVVTIPAGRFPEVLRTIRALVIDGSRSEAVRRLALALGGEGEPRDRFAQTYGALLQLWTHVPDPYGEERLYPPEVSAETLAGDCDDATTLVLALARALGFRGAVVVMSTEEHDGGVTVQHAYAAVELDPGTWTPADLDTREPLGSAPSWPGATRSDVFPVEDAAPGTVGFLPALLGAVAGIGAAIIGARSQKQTATIQADAARDAKAVDLQVAERNARALEAQALALREQSDDALEATRLAAKAATQVALIEERRQALAVAAGAQATGSVLSLVRELAYELGPVVAVVALVRFAAPVAAAAFGGGRR